MNNKLKILTEFGIGNHRSLLIELEKAIADKLDVDENGMVDTVDFINACLTQMGYQITDAESIDLQELIFNTDLAVDAGKRQ